ncbi:UDP-3-O-(3-hydroxymyristoyl)glucosamine N-acyltransferase [Bdellovibrionota bacterium FG-1]
MAVASFGVSEICRWIGGRVVNGELLEAALDSIRVECAGALGKSQPNEVAFFFSKNYQQELPSARPGILVTGEAFVGPLLASGLPCLKTSVIVACPDPYLGMALISEKLARGLSTVAHLVADALDRKGPPEVHPSAVVDSSAELGLGVKVGAHSVIEAGARIGAGSVIYPGCFVGPKCLVGECCVFFPNVVIYEGSLIGNRVRIHANSTVGSDGFGYAVQVEKTVQGIRPLKHHKIYHLGKVVIGDDVEIGANSCIDRGTLSDTRIERGAKIDNQVHLGHNSFIDEGAILCGAVTLAGHASVGKFAYVGGLTGVTNQVHIGDGAKVAAMTLVSKDIAPGQTAVGNPQRAHREHFRVHAWLNKLALKGTRRSKESEDQK